MERTIPIFRALISSDTEKRFHQNYGQLGFALKDQRNPQWAEAEAALSEAIRIRNAQGDIRWWKFYEFNRAVCRIMQDADSLGTSASSSVVRARILEDLRVVGDDEREVFKQQPVSAWLVLNKVAPAELSHP